jgi:hypothetical protein
MLQKPGTIYVLFRRYFGPIALAAAALLGLGNMGWADNNLGGSFKSEVKNDRAARLLTTVRVLPSATNTTAGALYSFDISWVDQPHRLYFLADRSNKVVDVVDTAANILVGQLTPGTGFAPFAGFTPCSPAAGANDCAGPNGVATLGQCLFVTDAPSRVVSFNFVTGATVSSVKTDPMDPTRADELAVDPRDSLILAINNAASPPYGTFIKFDRTTCALTPPNPATDRVTFNMAGGVNATNGAEQPLWDPVTAKFYLSIPRIGSANESGGVVRIDPITKKIDKTFGIMFCSPAGLTKGPNNDVLVGCNTVFDTAGGLWTITDPNTAAPIQVILDVKTGNQDQVGGVGVGDEVWYNKGDNNYYTASSTSPLRALDISGPADAQGAAILGIIDAKDEEVLQLVPTYNVAAVTTGPVASQHPAGTAHSVAVDAKNNHAFVPLAADNVFPNCLAGCIAVFGHPDEDEPGQAALP